VVVCCGFGGGDTVPSSRWPYRRLTAAPRQSWKLRVLALPLHRLERSAPECSARTSCCIVIDVVGRAVISFLPPAGCIDRGKNVPATNKLVHAHAVAIRFVRQVVWLRLCTPVGCACMQWMWSDFWWLACWRTLACCGCACCSSGFGFLLFVVSGLSTSLRQTDGYVLSLDSVPKSQITGIGSSARPKPEVSQSASN
jgi:hypothetical protein